MKNRSFDRALPCFFTQRLYGRDPDPMLELVSLDPVLERDKGVFENILRWEDDGGHMLDVGNPIDRSNPDMARELASDC